MKILHNAHIHTFNRASPKGGALVIDHGQIIHSGDDQAALSKFENCCSKDDLVNMQGKTVIPGLIDAHIHLQNYALGLDKVDCETSTKEECLLRIAERSIKSLPDQWIQGHGWNQYEWQDGFGTADDLDRVAPENPVYLTAKSLHAAWVNHAALVEANIDIHTPDPPDGRLSRDIRGQPTGILFENAMQLVSSQIPEPSSEDIVSAIDNAQPILWRMGLTGVHDFDRRASFAALQTLHQRGRLNLRVVKSIPLEDLEHAIGLGLRSGFGDDFLRIGSVKLFADGALGPRTAAMLQPYEGEPTNRGMLMLDAEELFEYGRQAVDNGLSLAVHAIGDRANHEVLNAMAQLRSYERDRLLRGQTTYQYEPAIEGSAVPEGRLRHRIEHVQIIHPEDADRLSELGVIASMQPIHATSDMNMAGRYWGERSELAYAWRRQLITGAVLAFGSDAPVESANPFWGIHAAVTRRRRDGTPDETGWYPEQKIGLTQAFQAYTAGAAYAAGVEDKCGRLSPGYLADLLVLDVDPFECSLDQLWDIKPLGTMIGGEWVYDGMGVGG